MTRSPVPVLLPARTVEAVGGVRAVFTTRQGGVSEGPFRSFNVAYGVGDEEARVAANRRALSAIFGAPLEALVEAEQVHGGDVAVVTAGEAGTVVPGVDALVTDSREVWLAVYTADCVPLLVVDPHRPAVAAVHAGWRGIARGIVAAVVRRMSEVFGSDPGRCVAALGPAIGPCCYEVDTPVAAALGTAPWWREAARPAGEGKWMLDLQRAVVRQLEEVGVPPNAVDVLGECTRCHPERFFSYRRDRVTGRMAACIGLRGGA